MRDEIDELVDWQMSNNRHAPKYYRCWNCRTGWSASGISKCPECGEPQL